MGHKTEQEGPFLLRGTIKIRASDATRATFQTVSVGNWVNRLREESWGTYWLSCRLLKGLNKGFIDYYRLLTQVRVLADMVLSDQPNQSLSSRRLVARA